MRSTITFYQIFFGDGTLSEKPKNGIKNCDFDFGWSKCWSGPSYRLSKIQKSTFQSLDSDRSLGPRRASWWVGRLIASSFERFRGLYEYKSHTGKNSNEKNSNDFFRLIFFSFEKIFSIWKNILDLKIFGFFPKNVIFGFFRKMFNKSSELLPYYTYNEPKCLL